MGRPKGSKNKKKVGAEIAMPDVSAVYRKPKKQADASGTIWDIVILAAIVAAFWLMWGYATSNTERLEAIDDCVRLKAADQMKPYGEAAWREFAPECELAIR
jgi:hypothetical protein